MVTEKEKQSREELFKLMAENPDLPIVPMVDSEIVADDGYNRWLGAWGSCYIGDYIIGEERLYYRDDEDWDEIERLVEEKLGNETFEVMSDEEAKAAYAAMPWIKAIIVNIDLPG